MKEIVNKVWIERYKIIRFLFSGAIGAGTNLLILYILTDLLHLYYVISVVISFIIATTVSFIMQKFWTFQDNSKEVVHSQALVFTVVAIINLFINTFIVYASVEFMGFHYLIGQVFASIIVAFESFFIYKIFIFKNKVIKE
jgi:putative flippase GtrA